MSKIEIPERAIVLAHRAFGQASGGWDIEVTAAVTTAAPLIVAAELRRIAALYEGTASRVDDEPAIRAASTGFASFLGHRADELDPEGGQS